MHALPLALLPFVLFTGAVAAQCTNPWLPSLALPGADGAVHALLPWDPDGAGPAPARIAVAGAFAIAGAVRSDRLATFDPLTSTWGALPGLPASASAVVRALTVAGNGDLIAAGAFGSTTTAPLVNIARWNGFTWGPVGGGLNGTAVAVATMSNGDVVAAGAFTQAGGVAAPRVARWNGTTWSPLGAGPAGTGLVTALLALPNGELLAGVGTGVQRWNGATWAPMGGSLGQVYAFARTPSGDLFAGGELHSVHHVARWDGVGWVRLANGTNTSVRALATAPNGDLIAGGDFTWAGTGSAHGVARWNGSAWSRLGLGVEGLVQALAFDAGGDLLVGGQITQAEGMNGFGVSALASWDGASWSPVSRGFDQPVVGAATLPDGRVAIAGATVTNAGHVSVASGSGWTRIGTFTTPVNVLARAANGDLLAGGAFTSVDQTVASAIARWDGATWRGLGGGLTHSAAWPLPSVNAIAPLANGDVVVGGEFTLAGGAPANRVARWNGTAWSALGSGFATAPRVLFEQPDGQLIAGLEGSVQRWNGTTWEPIGWPFQGTVIALAWAHGGLVAAGGFSVAGGVQANNIARWNGTIWQPLGGGVSSTVRALHVLPDGDLAVFGSFATAGGVPANGVARWDGTAWSALGDGLGAGIGVGSGTAPTVAAVAATGAGDLVLVGSFTLAGGVPAARVAGLTTSCPATAVELGTGCAGSGGPNTLAPTSLPWLGSTFRSVATGLPANGLALALLGTAPTSIPLASLLPQGAPGCTLVVTPFVLDAVVPIGGTAALAVALPNTPSLVGARFHQQVLPLELAPGGALTSVTATNGLTMTLGSF